MSTQVLDIIMNVVTYMVIVANVLVLRKKPLLLFKALLAFLLIGEVTHFSMDYAIYALKNKDLAWEIRYIYGFFDTAFLTWMAIAYGNYPSPKKKALLAAATSGGIWILFLILHYLGILEFQVAWMESIANIILTLLFGFGIITRVEIPETPLVSGINFILVGFLIYLFSTIVIFGIQGTSIREEVYGFIHGALHILRDVFFLLAFYVEFFGAGRVLARIDK